MTLSIIPNLIQEKDVSRFRKYVPEGSGGDGCWEWQSARNKRTGYGKFWLQGKTVGAHRVAYLIWNGPIPAGEQIRHRCDNPPCVNPTHLLTGTGKQNAADALERDKYRRGATNGRAKLTVDQVDDIRLRCKRGERQNALAREFGVSKSAVWWIVSGRNWAGVGKAS